jgi:hypothetical protein
MYLNIDDFVEFENVSKLANLLIGVRVFVPAVKKITQSLTWA